MRESWISIPAGKQQQQQPSVKEYPNISIRRVGYLFRGRRRHNERRNIYLHLHTSKSFKFFTTTICQYIVTIFVFMMS